MKLTTTVDTVDAEVKTYTILPPCPLRPLWWRV